MEKAVELLDLRIYGGDSERVPTNVSEVNCLCPVCSGEHTSRRCTLNINFDENVFSCARCHFGGGVYHLISYYTKWPLADVEKNLKNGKFKEYKPNNDAVDMASSHEREENAGHALAPLSVRHDVYSEMASMLGLAGNHRAELRRRGLDDNAIDRIGFCSYPKFMSPTVIPKKLVARGLDLRGVPGFGILPNGDWAMARLADGGFLIPNRNGDGMIQGYQIRFDHPSDTTPKYGYFTSSRMMGGTKAGVWCSWAGIDIKSRTKGEPFDVVIIEGPLKAYIVNHITGLNIISVPGVSALTKVPSALQSMSSMGLRKAYIAYDMDSYENKSVAEQLERLRDLLRSLKIDNATLCWDRSYKGLDDYVSSQGFKEKFLV